MNDLFCALSSQGQGSFFFFFFANYKVPSRVYPTLIDYLNKKKSTRYIIRELLIELVIVVIHSKYQHFIRIYQILITCLIDVLYRIFSWTFLDPSLLGFFFAFSLAFNLRKNIGRIKACQCAYISCPVDTRMNTYKSMQSNLLW